MFFPSPVTYSLKLLKCYVGPSRQFKRPSQNSKPFNYHQHTSDQKPINKTNFLNSSAQPIFYIIPLEKPNSCVHLDRSQGCGSIFENKKTSGFASWKASTNILYDSYTHLSPTSDYHMYYKYLSAPKQAEFSSTWVPRRPVGALGQWLMVLVLGDPSQICMGRLWGNKFLL